MIAYVLKRMPLAKLVDNVLPVVPHVATLCLLCVYDTPNLFLRKGIANQFGRAYSSPIGHHLAMERTMNQIVEILPDRLAAVMQRELKSGSHDNFEAGLCFMEGVSYVAGEPWSDTPQCACPVIATFLRGWNDALPDARRTELLRDLIPRLVGSNSTPEVELKRSLLAADWLVRTHTPAWLRLAGLTAQADALAGLPEITAMAQIPGIKPAIEAVRRDASAARAAAGDAAWDAAWAAAGAAARAAAWAAAGDAAGDAAKKKLAPTVDELQTSALALVAKMLDVQA